MKWMQALLTPDERKVLLFLAVVLLAGYALYLCGVYAARLGAGDDALAEELTEDVPLIYDLRTVTLEELETVPGIGPVTAERILAWRQTHVPQRRSDLLEALGIGPQTFERIAPYFAPLAAADTLVAIASHESDERINMNSADERLLTTLPGIGPALAAAIVSWREVNGRFASPDDLTRVPGIGPQTLEKLKPLITTGDEQ